MIVKKILNKEFALQLPLWLKNRYVLTVLFFSIWMSVVDNDSFWVQYQLYKQYIELKETNSKTRQEIDNLKGYLNYLQGNSNILEKYARENYLLKQANETLFIYKQENKDKKK